MGFLLIPCIGPVSKFLGCIPLGLSMIIMGFFIAVCAGYSFLEAEVFFKNYKVFGVINYIGFGIIEGAVALLIVISFFIKKKCYSRLLYYLTIALTGITLSYNVFKMSIFDDIIKEYGIEHKLLQFMFLIRIGAEFIIQLFVCYMCYSLKKDL